MVGTGPLALWLVVLLCRWRLALRLPWKVLRYTRVGPRPPHVYKVSYTRSRAVSFTETWRDVGRASNTCHRWENGVRVSRCPRADVGVRATGTRQSRTPQLRDTFSSVSLCWERVFLAVRGPLATVTCVQNTALAGNEAGRPEVAARGSVPAFPASAPGWPAAAEVHVCVERGLPRSYTGPAELPAFRCPAGLHRVLARAPDPASPPRRGHTGAPQPRRPPSRVPWQSPSRVCTSPSPVTSASPESPGRRPRARTFCHSSLRPVLGLTSVSRADGLVVRIPPARFAPVEKKAVWLFVLSPRSNV